MDNLNALSAELKNSSGLLMDKLIGWANDLFLQIPNLVLSIVIFIVAIFIARFLRKLVNRIVQKYTTNKTIVNLATNVTSVVFAIIIGLTILSVFNLDGAVNKFLATAGILGLAIGLALQDPLTNLFSGVLMSVRKLYNIGDIVETNGYFGIITTISLRSTIITTPQGQKVTIPNRDVIQKPLVNYSIDGLRRLDLKCGISYGEDLERVKKVALEAVGSIEDLEKSKPVKFYFNEFGDSSINFILQLWVPFSAQSDFLKFRSDAIIALKKAFDQADIMIPYPIRTLDFGIKGGVPMIDMINGKKESVTN